MSPCSRLIVGLKHCAESRSCVSAGGAPSAIRTRDLLLRSNPAADAVANSDGAGQASGGAHCYSPSYLVITSRDTGPTIATKDTAWIV
jgi:hypothetical protein